VLQRGRHEVVDGHNLHQAGKGGVAEGLQHFKFPSHVT
jgi:hypothetical protein